MAPYDHGLWFEDVAQLNWEYGLPETQNMPPKNPGLKEMWEYFKSVPKYWIRNFGIDGFRCDIAYKVPPAFWTACIAEAREEARISKTNLSKDVVFVAEAMTDSLQELQEAGFTAVYGDFSNKLKYPQDFFGYLNYMYNRNQSHFPIGSKWFVFPEVHDFDRTPRKILGDNLEDGRAAYLANKSRWLLTATVPGIPLIFNGFEKVEWKPINLFGYGAVDWKRDSDLSTYLERVNAIRREIPALSLTGDFIPLETNQGLNESTQLVAYLRKKGKSFAIIVVNMDVYNHAGPAIVKLPEEFNRAYRLKDELSGQEFTRSGQELVIVLDQGEGHLFSVRWL
jgi:1,4-alpha-glucan branching enzyme